MSGLALSEPLCVLYRASWCRTALWVNRASREAASQPTCYSVPAIQPVLTPGRFRKVPAPLISVSQGTQHAQGPKPPQTGAVTLLSLTGLGVAEHRGAAAERWAAAEVTAAAAAAHAAPPHGRHDLDLFAGADCRGEASTVTEQGGPQDPELLGIQYKVRTGMSRSAHIVTESTNQAIPFGGLDCKMK